MKTTEIKDPKANSRYQMVVQSNDFIRHPKSQLTAQEQNIAYFLISKVKPTDTDFMKISFTVEEFCELCGMDSKSGKNYSDIKYALKSLSDKSAWTEYRDEKGRRVETLVRWVDTYEIWPDSGEMTAVLSQSIKPFLLGLVEKGFYTQAELITLLALQSRYSKRLYELLKSYISMDIKQAHRYVFKEFEIMELKKLLGAETYGRFADFNRRVLDIAMREINEVTDISVSYTPIKPRRITTHISFTIQLKKDTERFGAYLSAEKKFSKTKAKVNGDCND